MEAGIKLIAGEVSLASFQKFKPMIFQMFVENERMLREVYEKALHDRSPSPGSVPVLRHKGMLRPDRTIDPEVKIILLSMLCIEKNDLRLREDPA